MHDHLKLVVVSPPGSDHLRVLERLPPEVSVKIGNSVEELADAITEADVILNGAFRPEPFRSLFPLAKRVRWVHSLSAGVETTLTPEVAASPAPLTNGRGVFADSLAEFVIGAALFFAKDFRRMLRNQEAGRWEAFDVDWLRGTVMGIVGFGAIGQASAALGRALGMHIAAVRRRPELSSGVEAYGPDHLHEMLAKTDYLVVAAPHTAETRGLIGEPELKQLKQSAVVINVGRGPVIVETALVHALEEKWIRGAALDVFDHEPLPDGHPFYRLENVLLSPHCADHTPGWIGDAMHLFVDNFERFLAGRPLENMVDKQAGY